MSDTKLLSFCKFSLVFGTANLQQVFGTTMELINCGLESLAKLNDRGLSTNTAGLLNWIKASASLLSCRTNYCPYFILFFFLFQHL